jgi:hypothetical protein
MFMGYLYIYKYVYIYYTVPGVNLHQGPSMFVLVWCFLVETHIMAITEYCRIKTGRHVCPYDSVVKTLRLFRRLVYGCKLCRHKPNHRVKSMQILPELSEPNPTKCSEGTPEARPTERFTRKPFKKSGHSKIRLWTQIVPTVTSPESFLSQQSYQGLDSWGLLKTLLLLVLISRLSHMNVKLHHRRPNSGWI